MIKEKVRFSHPERETGEASSDAGKSLMECGSNPKGYRRDVPTFNYEPGSGQVGIRPEITRSDTLLVRSDKLPSQPEVSKKLP